MLIMHASSDRWPIYFFNAFFGYNFLNDFHFYIERSLFIIEFPAQWWIKQRRSYSDPIHTLRTTLCLWCMASAEKILLPAIRCRLVVYASLYELSISTFVHLCLTNIYCSPIILGWAWTAERTTGCQTKSPTLCFRYLGGTS